MSRTLLPLFAAVLRNLREQAACTQGELEQAAGYERGRVSKIELGSRPLGRVELERLVRLLGYDHRPRSSIARSRRFRCCPPSWRIRRARRAG